MLIPRRVKWTQGQFSMVDGIPFRMPVASRNTPMLIAAFSIDADKARAILPCGELHPFRLWNRGVMAIEVLNYTDTPIGRYVEFCIGIVCTRGRRPAPRLLPGLLTRWFGTGQYIYDLPVSTEISVKGGLGIWGMAKRRASLDFVAGDEWVSSQYDLDGQLVMRVDVRRGGRPWIPMRMRGVGYGAFRGMLTKSYVYLRGGLALTWGKTAGRLLIGDHPRMDPIKALDVDPEPILAGFSPSTQGWLDDHVESWFLVHPTMPSQVYPGFDQVSGLKLSQEWPEPPDRVGADAVMAKRFGDAG